MEGNIFDIQRFCVHDGPGIRTTVFLKGCPLKCIWCHNPESQKATVDLAFYAYKCISCGDCVQACPENCHTFVNEKHVYDRSVCISCGKCATACTCGSLELLGSKKSVADIIAETLKDKNFYKNSGGGMTVSGGDPLMQEDFLVALLKNAKAEGIHTCVETCGFASQKTVAKVAEYTDIFLYDIKETDDDRHKALTGVPFSPILHNLMYLDSLGARIILRCPLIPEINTREKHLQNIAKIAASLDHILEVNVMAYHLLGEGKYDALDMDNKMRGHKAMTAEQKEYFIKDISKRIKEISGKKIKVC